MTFTAPPMASRREYIEAAISRIMIGAVVLPASKMACMISRPRMPLAMPRAKAPKAPKPAASVGVKMPPQMPPITRMIKARIPTPPMTSPRSASGDFSSSNNSLVCGAMSGLRSAAKTQ